MYVVYLKPFFKAISIQILVQASNGKKMRNFELETKKQQLI